MPELPEVQTVVTTLGPHVTGRTIRAVHLNRKDILRPYELDLRAHLSGRTITSISRRGKKIVFTLDDTNRFYIHLGMSGRLTAEPKRAELRRHTHLIIDIGERELRFVDPRRFGGVWWLGRDQSADDNLGPEPLRMKPDQLAARLARTTRAIKNALLDHASGHARRRPARRPLGGAGKIRVRDQY